jgi:hypothetical protein
LESRLEREQNEGAQLRRKEEQLCEKENLLLTQQGELVLFTSALWVMSAIVLT